VIIYKNIKVVPQIIAICIIFLLAKIILYIADYFSKKDFNDLTKNFKRNLIKFLINNKKNLNGEENKIGEITNNVTNVFFRSIVQLVPSAVVFLCVFVYFLTNSFFYTITICGYIIYSMIIKRDNGILKDKKQYLQHNNTADNYMEKNKFQGNEDDVEDPFEVFFKDNTTNPDSVNDNNIQVINAENNKKPSKNILYTFFKGIRKEIYFILLHSLTFILVNIHNITFIKTILFSFFTFQIIILSKIVINTHYLNVKNINSIKKQLNCINDI
jgi:hypothetical protein